MALAAYQFSSVASFKKSSKDEDIEAKVSNFINEFFGIAVAPWPRHAFENTRLQSDRSLTDIAPLFGSSTVPATSNISEGKAASLTLQRLDSLGVKRSCSDMCLGGLTAREDCSVIKLGLANEKDLEAAIGCREAFRQDDNLVEATKNTPSNLWLAKEGAGTTIHVAATNMSCVFLPSSHYNVASRETGSHCSNFHMTENFSRAVDHSNNDIASLCFSNTDYVIKPSLKKPPKPPKTQNPELKRHPSDGYIIQRLQVLRRERMRFKRKKPRISTSHTTSFWALVTTICFAVLVVVQGLMSQGNANLKELESSGKISSSHVIMHGKVLPYREAILLQSSESRTRAKAGMPETQVTVVDVFQHRKEPRDQLLQSIYGSLRYS